uniref:Uncharacterized protein n=1 Tax=Oryza punctata TaxID=4537 RepID=A0A0E0LTZ9_ORYPU
MVATAETVTRKKAAAVAPGLMGSNDGNHWLRTAGPRLRLQLHELEGKAAAGHWLREEAAVDFWEGKTASRLDCGGSWEDERD